MRKFFSIKEALKKRQKFEQLIEEAYCKEYVKQIRLKRYLKMLDSTRGYLEVITNKQILLLQTLEKTSKEIPEGNYILKKEYSYKFNRDMWRIINVPNRSGILIHSGNSKEDTEGCILLGKIGYNDKVLKSREALRLLDNVLDKNKQYRIDIL